MSACAWLAVALAASALGQADEHKAPAETIAVGAKAAEDQKQATLAEMWQRRLLSTDSKRWSPEDLELLERMRGAERKGALRLLRKRASSLAGLTVTLRQPGEKDGSLRLTREGYEKWLALRSQEAVDYFERKGADTRWVFLMVDLEGHRLFDGGGKLTPRGHYVYDLASVNMPVWWKVPQTGEIFGTRPPPKK